MTSMRQYNLFAAHEFGKKIVQALENSDRTPRESVKLACIASAVAYAQIAWHFALLTQSDQER